MRAKENVTKEMRAKESVTKEGVTKESVTKEMYAKESCSRGGYAEKKIDLHCAEKAIASELQQKAANKMCCGS